MNDSTIVSADNLVFIVGGEVRDRRDDIRRRVQEHIDRLLNLKTLVVLFGSGTCFHLNGPSIRSMTLDAINELVSTHAPEPLTADESRMLEITSGDAESVNLELVLSALNSMVTFVQSVESTSVTVGGTVVSTSILKGLRTKLNAALAGACDLEAGANRLEEPVRSSPWKAHQEFFRRLLCSRRSDLTPSNVFTTNYDLAIELSLDASAVDYIDGFKGTVRRSFHPEVYNRALFTSPGPDQRRLLPVPSAVYYFKLHGSINWRYATLDGRRTIIQLNDKVKEDAGLAVIYPTQEKELETLGFPYADLFRSFADALQSPDVGLISIGYGFNDDHITRITNTALSTNYSLQLLIVDPGAIFEDCAAAVEDLKYRDTAVASIARRADARVSCLTGSDAAFTSFATKVMPDIDAEPESEPDRPQDE